MPRFLTLFASANLWWVLAAFVILNIAQLASALRMQYYYQVESLSLTTQKSIILYYIGMLLNVVLPGGISGDGYKAIVIKRDYNFPLGKSIRLMISGRANGLLFLILIGLLFGAFSHTLPTIIPYTLPLIIVAAVITIVGYTISAKWLLKETYTTQLRASHYSFWVQALVAVCCACLFEALNTTYAWHGHAADYLMLFMVSSFVSVLPISVGGIGLRELTFYYGTLFLGMNAEAGVAVAVLYFIINLCASLIGLIFFLSYSSRKNLNIVN